MSQPTAHLKLGTQEDAPDIKRMAFSFFENSPYAKYGIEESKVDQLTEEFTTSSLTRLCLLLQVEGKSVGILAALSSPNIFNNKYMCCELIWWIDPEYRGYQRSKMMVDAYEYWAREKVHAQIIQLVTLDPALGKYYKRLGFDRAEEAWIKEV